MNKLLLYSILLFVYSMNATEGVKVHAPSQVVNAITLGSETTAVIKPVDTRKKKGRNGYQQRRIQEPRQQQAHSATTKNILIGVGAGIGGIIVGFVGFIVSLMWFIS